jgi:hypothetical protein
LILIVFSVPLALRLRLLAARRCGSQTSGHIFGNALVLLFHEQEGGCPAKTMTLFG